MRAAGSPGRENRERREPPGGGARSPGTNLGPGVEKLFLMHWRASGHPGGGLAAAECRVGAQAQKSELKVSRRRRGGVSRPRTGALGERAGPEGSSLSCQRHTQIR